MNKLTVNKTTHVIIALVLYALIAFLVPASNGLTEIGVRTIGAAVATVYLWTFVATDWTSILSVLLFAITGVMPFGTLLTTGATPVLLIITMSAVTIPLSRTGFIARVIDVYKRQVIICFLIILKILNNRLTKYIESGYT